MAGSNDEHKERAEETQRGEAGTSAPEARELTNEELEQVSGGVRVVKPKVY